MTERLTLQLNDAQSGHQVMVYGWAQYAKPRLLAGHRLQVEFKPQTRSLAQNRLLHSILRDIAEQVEWAGQLRDADAWKRLLTSAWLRARGENVEILPAVDGHGVDVVFRKTSRMTKAELSELCEYAWAWGSEREVEWSPTSLGEEHA